ncbi:right-handed parallel beta-helix repeat-containing protein [Coraliomargarita parva]|uniref:right-handed parallel beta-helix repeat-containing protein n=1 Tax=Coraliomargarita parva TaxID=3014050 RepID=UPI0022B4C17D|nr:right-handed parallel beta-helix repeat-containing protein [Coraliomargarita parva]
MKFLGSESLLKIFCTLLAGTHVLTGSILADQVKNLPDTFYERPGLEAMPHINYEAMPVVNVKELGALGDGEQISNPFFDQAVEQLQAQGGGVIFIPKGHYLFRHDKEDPTATVMDYGRPKLGSIWPALKHSRLEDIHFVGEGMETVLEFDFAGDRDQYALHVAGFSLDKAKNVSLRDLSITQSPFFRQRRGGDIKMGSSFRATKCHDIQLTGVYVDQGELGIGFWHGENIWVVDCDVRNTRADSIKFDASNHVTMAYTHMEEPMDDNGSMIYFRKLGHERITDLNLLYNTSLGPAFGRGFIFGGSDIRIEGNWYERTFGSGITSWGDYPNDFIIKDNTLVRCGLAARADNPRSHYTQPEFSSVLKFSGKDGVVTNNKIYGAETHGVYFGKLENVLFEGNRIEGGRNGGVVFGMGQDGGDGPLCSDLTFRNNTMIANASDLVVRGEFHNLQAAHNRISNEAQLDHLSGDADAQSAVEASLEQVDADSGEYRDVYAFARVPTGAVADRPMPERPASDSELTLNVRDFGAVGDGQSNDCAAIQKAIDALPESGGTVFIPKGTYRIAPVEGEDTFEFTAIRHHLLVAERRNVRVMGEGAGSLLVFDSLEHQGLRFVACEDVAVCGIALQASHSVMLRRNRALLDFSGCRGVWAEEIHTQGGNGPAIQLDTCNQAVVRDCEIRGSKQYGIRVEASCWVKVLENDIRNIRDSGIHVGYSGSILRDSDYVVLRGNQIDGTTEGAGLTVISGKVEVADNQIRNTFLSGLYVYQPAMGWAMNELNVHDNLFESCGQHAVHSAILFSTPLRRGDRGRVKIYENTFKEIPHQAVHVTFGRNMVWGPQGFTSFVVKENTFEAVAGEKVWIDKKIRSDNKDGDIRIEYLDIDHP